MTANHPRDVLDLIESLKRRIGDLEASRALGPQPYKSVTLAVNTPSISLPLPANATPGSLRVIWQARGDNASPATYMCVRFNGDSGNNYLWEFNQANNATAGPGGSGALVGQIQIGTMPAASATSGYVGCGEFVVPVPLGAAFKAASGHSTSVESTTNSYSGTYGGLWLSTAAVTSITLLPLNGNLVAGSTASLYGVN